MLGHAHPRYLQFFSSQDSIDLNFVVSTMSQHQNSINLSTQNINNTTSATLSSITTSNTTISSSSTSSTTLTSINFPN